MKIKLCSHRRNNTNNYFLYNPNRVIRINTTWYFDSIQSMYLAAKKDDGTIMSAPVVLKNYKVLLEINEVKDLLNLPNTHPELII